MEIEAINCPKCGAPLPEVKDGGLILCMYCGSRVTVKETRAGKFKVSINESVLDLVSEQAFLRTLEGQLVKLNGEKHQIHREKEKINLELHKPDAKKNDAPVNFHFASCSGVMFFALMIGVILWTSFDSLFAFFVAAAVGLVVAMTVGAIAGDAKAPKKPEVVEPPTPSPLLARLSELSEKEQEISKMINLVHKSINQSKQNINQLSTTIAARR